MKTVVKKIVILLIGLLVFAISAIAFPPNYTIWKSSIAKEDSTFEEIEANKGFLSSKEIVRSDINPVYIEGKLEDILDKIDERVVSYEFFGWGFLVIYDEMDRLLILIEDRI